MVRKKRMLRVNVSRKVLKRTASLSFHVRSAERCSMFPTHVRLP